MNPVVILMLFVCVRGQQVTTIAQGEVLGRVYDGYVSYHGIPYASINGTTGRFKRAGLAPTWKDVREPTRPTCSPLEINSCLTLDVHVPVNGHALPVLAWVRGLSGMYNPSELVLEGIIVVVIYHRVGAPGFACLREPDIPGNAGLKDVVSALRWIRDNIIAFKGNPALVVVAGQGFGAAMVEALTISSSAKTLFHGVILQSGTVLSPSAFNYHPERRAKIMAKLIGKYDTPASRLINADLKQLEDAAKTLSFPYFPFGICVEKKTLKDEPFLTESPIELLRTGKTVAVPMMIGYNSQESYALAYFLKKSKVLSRISRDMSFLLPTELKFSNEWEREQALRQIKDMYFKRNATMGAVLEYHDEAYFISHIHRSVRLQSGASTVPVYYYQFSYAGEAGVAPEPGVVKRGAAHSDELAYLFAEGYKFKGPEESVQKHLIRMWTNFVKYLKPSPAKDEVQWTPTNGYKYELLDIGAELELKQFPRGRSTQLWDHLYESHYYRRHY